MKNKIVRSKQKAKTQKPKLKAELCTSETRFAKDEMTAGTAEGMTVLSENNSKKGKK